MYSRRLQTAYSIPDLAPAPGGPKLDRENVEVLDVAAGEEKLCETPDPKDIRPSFLLDSVCFTCTALGSLLVLSCNPDETAGDATLLCTECTHNQYSILKIVHSFLTPMHRLEPSRHQHRHKKNLRYVQYSTTTPATRFHT